MVRASTTKPPTKLFASTSFLLYSAQEIIRGVVALVASNAERGVAALVFQGRIGARFEQQGGHIRLIGGGGDHQRRDTTFVRGIDICAVIEQRLGGPIRKTRNGEHQRRVAAAYPFIDI